MSKGNDWKEEEMLVQLGAKLLLFAKDERRLIIVFRGWDSAECADIAVDISKWFRDKTVYAGRCWMAVSGPEQISDEDIQSRLENLIIRKKDVVVIKSNTVKLHILRDFN